MTTLKLDQLRDSFPTVDESTLLEVLVSCNGSLKSSEALLSESFPNYKLKHNNSNSRQSNIESLFGEESKDIKKTSKSNKPIHLYTKQDIENTIQFITVHFNFLPIELSNSLLTFVMNDKRNFTPQEFHLFGNKCKSNHSNKLYTNQDYKGYFYNGFKSDLKDPYTDDLKLASLLVEDKVNSEINSMKLLPFQDMNKWKADVAVCNKFEKKSNDLDWHSDRMTYIGPHCVIASLTLGACREFRIRRQYHNEDGSPSTIYAIPLPHNTLVVMHAGFQEEYKHCISSTTEIQNHEISGSLRVNLTYRNYVENFKINLPMCSKCGKQMDLRRSFKNPDIRGRYIWLCTSGYSNKECNGFYWANFKNKNLISNNFDESSIWINKTDRLALKAFRQYINEKLKEL